MKKNFSPLRVISKVAIAPIGVGLLIAVIYLVVSQYRSQVAVQQTAIRLVAYNSERRATAFGYFLSEQRNIVKELAESSEIKAYFENKALGMSLEYGLQASVQIITEHFDNVRQKKNMDDHPIFERIVFVDTTGQLLNDSRAPNQNWSKARDWIKFITPTTIKPEIVCDKEEDTLYLIISVPSFFKERYTGQVMAWISFSQMYKYLFESQNVSSGFPDVIVYGKEYLHIPSSIKPLLTSQSALPDDIQPGKPYPLPVYDNSNGNRIAYAIIVPVKDSSFSLMTVIPPAEQFDFRSPRQLLYTTCGVALFIIFGMFILIRLNTSNALLRVSLEETLLREQAVDAKNHELATEIKERLLAEEEKAKLENQLLQSQKMEAVGKLAGGVAHDFNNMLGVIIGYTELALRKLEPSQPVYANLIEISKAAERSADLTRQLLAFARKQTIAPKIIDLNETISGMLKMLQRLIGENINLTLQTSANLWRIKADQSQIDQLLANLCVNSRDAITDFGKITIETANFSCGVKDSVSYTNYVEPGEYVRLSVSDNGSGMNNETMTHIFEPFFTTKGVGEGTGLGLATVYGIVKQNNGFINVHSELGCGTTFTIYLPRYIGENEEALKDVETGTNLRGTETILLVEDEPAILEMAALTLEEQGYTVIIAGTAYEAIRLFKEQASEIHMVMTDVVMPDMNGRDLVEELLKLKPQLKCLFMSGYSANVIAHHGVLDEGVHFIQKPFRLPELTSKVREVLDKTT